VRWRRLVDDSRQNQARLSSVVPSLLLLLLMLMLRLVMRMIRSRWSYFLRAHQLPSDGLGRHALNVTEPDAVLTRCSRTEVLTVYAIKLPDAVTLGGASPAGFRVT